MTIKLHVVYLEILGIKEGVKRTHCSPWEDKYNRFYRRTKVQGYKNREPGGEGKRT